MWSAFLSYSDDSGVSLSTKNKTGIHFYALWTVRFMFEALEERLATECLFTIYLHVRLYQNYLVQRTYYISLL